MFVLLTEKSTNRKVYVNSELVRTVADAGGRGCLLAFDSTIDESTMFHAAEPVDDVAMKFNGVMPYPDGETEISQAFIG